jgi:hypothetical protein
MPEMARTSIRKLQQIFVDPDFFFSEKEKKWRELRSEKYHKNSPPKKSFFFFFRRKKKFPELAEMARTSIEIYDKHFPNKTWGGGHDPILFCIFQLYYHRGIGAPKIITLGLVEV